MARSEEAPSWAVIDASDRLIAERALFQAGRDGFGLRKNGDLVQFELPGKEYRRRGRDWLVYVRSARWRETKGAAWQAWRERDAASGGILLGQILVSVLSSGVRASWSSDRLFAGLIPPSDTMVPQRISNTHIGHPFMAQRAVGARNPSSSRSRSKAPDPSPATTLKPARTQPGQSGFPATGIRSSPTLSNSPPPVPLASPGPVAEARNGAAQVPDILPMVASPGAPKLEALAAAGAMALMTLLVGHISRKKGSPKAGARGRSRRRR